MGRKLKWKVRNVSAYKPAGRDSDRHPWLIAYRLPGAKRRTVETCSADQGVAEQRAIAVARLIDRKRWGLITDQDERAAAAAAVPLADHVDEFYEEQLASVDTEKQAKEVRSRLRKVLLEWCEFATLADLDAGAVKLAVSTWKGDNDRSPEIANKYLKACKQFSSWLGEPKRYLLTHPLRSLKGWSVEQDRRHERRALTVDELRLLLAATAAGADYQGVKGPDRRMLYMLAAYTGLRRSELASLTHASFDLEGDRPTVTVLAAHSKHRKTDVVRVGGPVVGELRAWLATRRPRRPVFDVPAKAFLMLYADLRAAGIPVETEEGIADFHALRHTFITLQAQMIGAVPGVTIKTVMMRARHSDMRLTARYMTMHLQDEDAAVDAMPPLDEPAAPQAEQARATGTYDAAPDAPAVQRPAERPAVPTRPGASRSGPGGAEGGAPHSATQPVAPPAVYGKITPTDNLGLRSRRLEVRALSGTRPQPTEAPALAPPPDPGAGPGDGAPSALRAARPPAAPADPAAAPLDLDAIRRLHEQLGALLSPKPPEPK